MEIKKQKEHVICLLLAFLTSLAFCIENDNYILPEELYVKLGNKIAVFLWQLNNAVAQPKYIICIASVLLYFAYRYLWGRVDKKLFKWSITFSIIAAFLLLICESFYQYNSWDKVFGGQTAFFLSMIKALGIAVLIFFLFQIICHLKIELEDSAQKKGTKGKGFFVITLILLICWLPYIIIMFPGNFCPDSVDEIAQIVGNRDYCWTIKTIIPETEEILWNNHHPVFYTWLLSIFVRLGQVIGSATVAFASYTVLQCLCMAMTFAYLLGYAKGLGVSQKVRTWILLFFALNPLFPLWGVAITKDTFFSMALLLSVLYLHRLLKHPDTCKIKDKIILGIWLFLMMLLRNNGFYMLLVIVPFIVCFLWKEKKQMVQALAVVVVPMLIFQIGVQGVIFSAFHIPKGSIREMLSVSFQQTARYIAEYGDELDEDDTENILAVLGKDNELLADIGNAYVPDHADAVKNRFKPGTTDEELKKYFETWVAGLKAHPDVYIEAFLNLHYSWFIFDSNQDFHYYYEITEEEARVTMQKTAQRADTMLGGLERLAGFEETCDILMYVVNSLSRLPFLSWVMEFSAYTWMYIVCGLIMLMRKKYCELLACGMIYANYLICFIGPVAYTRYAIPMIVCLPFVALLTFAEKREAD